MDDQQVHEKMLYFTNHYGSANQNHNEILPVRMTNIKKQGIIIAGENVKHKKQNPNSYVPRGKMM